MRLLPWQQGEVPPEEVGVCACGKVLGRIDGTERTVMCRACAVLRQAASEWERRGKTVLREALRPLITAQEASNDLLRHGTVTVSATIRCPRCAGEYTVAVQVPQSGRPLRPNDTARTLKSALPERCPLCPDPESAARGSCLPVTRAFMPVAFPSARSMRLMAHVRGRWPLSPPRTLPVPSRSGRCWLRECCA